MIRHCIRAAKVCRRDLRQALRYTRAWFGRWGWVALGLLAMALLGVWWLRPLDEVVSHAVAVSNGDAAVLKPTARMLSYLGDFLGFNVVLFVVLQVAGWSLRSRRLVRVAVASLLCACLSGAVANLVRGVVGRPRPCTAMVDGLYGPSFRGDMHSLPSAHTATAFGAALPVMSDIPAIGVPLTVFAGGVAWSRLQLARHHFTDVMVSVMLSGLFSLPLSHWAMRGRRRALVARAEVPAHSVSHALAATRQSH
jgi:undecaprenyl-diphosphatase